MRCHLYVSRCVDANHQFYDLAILRTALRRNAKFGITGFMHRNETHYFQYVEGESADVSTLIDNIKTDHRHTEYDVLMDKEITERQFEGWSMGYTDGSSKAESISRTDAPEVILDYLLAAAKAQDGDLERVATKT